MGLCARGTLEGGQRNVESESEFNDDDDDERYGGRARLDGVPSPGPAQPDLVRHVLACGNRRCCYREPRHRFIAPLRARRRAVWTSRSVRRECS